MGEPIEDEYFNWLYAKVAYRTPSSPSTRYESLLYFLHRTEFQWHVAEDENRALEGQSLRREFLREAGISIDDPWMELECSVLEMLVALAIRCAFNTSMNASEWFWVFMTNLGLSELSDSAYSMSEKSYIIGPIMETFVWRLYDSHGHGGIFPLRHTVNDQRKVELWYQFAEYVVDQAIS